MKHYPVFLDLSNKRCLVIGGGTIATRKVAALIEANAKVVVIAPKLSAQLQLLLQQQKISHIMENFAANQLEQTSLVIAATNDSLLNAQISGLAQQRNILVNVVDNPALCSFILPAVLDRAPLQIAISTGGSSPLLAQLLKSRLESMLSPAYGKLALLLSSFRSEVKQRFPNAASRRQFWEKILGGSIAELVFTGNEDAAKQALQTELHQPNQPQKTGEVYLVGAGPGAVDLLTFRALRLMQQADVVLYDRLVAPAIVALVRKDAERIYVGKAKGSHTLSQQEINQILLNQAKLGKRVLRLKGGDPFIFGRGGEEIENLSSAQIPFQVVPGITAASGCASYAGIPLTHRDYAQTCVFLTAHLKNSALELDWSALSAKRQTLVIYMGLFGVELLCQKLIQHGLSANLPAALIENGTTEQQRVLIADLSSLAKLASQEKASSPSLIIVGEVVNLHAKLAWFKHEKNKAGE